MLFIRFSILRRSIAHPCPCAGGRDDHVTTWQMRYHSRERHAHTCPFFPPRFLSPNSRPDCRIFAQAPGVIWLDRTSCLLRIDIPAGQGSVLVQASSDGVPAPQPVRRALAYPHSLLSGGWMWM